MFTQGLRATKGRLLNGDVEHHSVTNNVKGVSAYYEDVQDR